MKRSALRLLPGILAVLFALIFGASAASAVTEKILHTFSAHPRGFQPGPTLVADASGNLYGTSNLGGTQELGTVFEMTPNATGGLTETVLYSFKGGNDGANPRWGVILDAAGNLYGTTYDGGSSGTGTVFELKRGPNNSWTESIIYNFTGGSYAQPQSGLVADASGSLYGTAAGSIFELSPSSGSWAFSVLYTFTGDDDGSYPSGPLVFDTAGSMYGTTQFGGFNDRGTVFELSPKPGGWTETVLYRFLGLTVDGTQPMSGVVLDKAGNLYGTTESGGNPACPGGCGTVFKLATNGGGAWTETLLHTFAGTDGFLPQGSLTFDTTGHLYGSAPYGGHALPCSSDLGCGVVFQLTLGAGGHWSERILSSFSGTAKGPSLLFATPIFDSAGNLYGTTLEGGPANAGTLFKLTPAAVGKWTKKVLYTFNSYDGVSPGRLISDSSGNLYGATFGGGTFANGSIFKLTPNPNGSWTRTLLYSFKGTTDGASPSPLTMDHAGNLYGTTRAGGNATCNNGYGCGVVFELAQNPQGVWTQTVLHTFTGIDGNTPYDGVILDPAGNLYGTTFFGGSLNFGTVFELTPSSGGTWTESILHSFIAYPNDGDGPVGGLIIDLAGNLYGTTSDGGPGYYGVVFELMPSSNGQWSESILHGFSDSPDGAYPYARVAFDEAGNLYGVTGDGGNTSCGGGCGVVFKLTPSSGGAWTETILRSFSLTGSDGHGPPDELTFDAAGNLYGETGSGGTTGCSGYGCGALFKFSPASGGQWTETVVHTFTGKPGDGIGSSAVLFDPTGKIYGASGGGTANEGVVYELIP
jgi:uncharacterized repeat protein (TIGR03803 family)